VKSVFIAFLLTIAFQIAMFGTAGAANPAAGNNTLWTGLVLIVCSGLALLLKLTMWSWEFN